MISMKELNSGHLEELSNGKATESLQMRFNEREFEILNQAFSRSENHRSRHAWLVDVVMKEARCVLANQGVVIDPDTNLLK